MRFRTWVPVAAVGALLLANAGPAAAQSFNQFFGFGDSTIDTGNYRGLVNRTALE